MNRDLLLNTSKFITERAKQFASQLNEKIASSTIKTKTDALHEIFSSIKEFFLSLGKPTMKKRKVYDFVPPASSDINDTFREIYNDTRLMADESALLGVAFKQSFNHTTTDKLRLRNRVKSISEKVNDYIVLAKNTISRCFIIQDSFSDLTKTDMSGIGNPALVDTKSGVVILQPKGTINRSEEAQVLSVTAKPGYAFPGNFLVAYKKDSLNDKIDNLQEGQRGEEWDLYYNTDPHEDESAILDGNPETWYEYQMINVKEEYKVPGAKPIDTRGYGWTWSDGNPIYYGNPNSDSLNCVITIKLKEPCTINWIDLYPYLPSESSYVTINEVATSLNNAGDYVTCLLDPGDRGMKIGANTQTTDLDFKDRQKFKGHGVWVFPARKAQYIKLDLTVEKPYTCPIAHIYWEVEYDVVTHTTFLFLFHSYSKEHKKERVDGPRFDRNKVLAKKNYAIEGALAGGIAGAFLGAGLLGAAVGLLVGLLSSSETYIENLKEAKMGLDIYQDGFRWCLGIRGIDIQSNIYEEKSVFMSKNFPLTKPIKEISLSVSEFIPDEFYSNNIITKNEWIKYYVSVDNGTTWYPISPMERTPVDGETSFPPKVIAIANSPGEIANKSYILSKDDVRNIRLMAEFRRPPDAISSTPVLYDYKLRILPKEGVEQL